MNERVEYGQIAMNHQINIKRRTTNARYGAEYLDTFSENKIRPIGSQLSSLTLDQDIGYFVLRFEYFPKIFVYRFDQH